MPRTIALLRLRLARRLFTLSILSLGITQKAIATDYIWSSATGGSWTNTTLWTPTGFPGNSAGDRATINVANASNYTVAYSTTQTIANLTVSSTQAILSLNGGSLTVTGSTVLSSGTISLNGGTFN